MGHGGCRRELPRTKATPDHSSEPPECARTPINRQHRFYAHEIPATFFTPKKPIPATSALPIRLNIR